MRGTLVRMSSVRKLLAKISDVLKTTINNQLMYLKFFKDVMHVGKLKLLYRSHTKNGFHMGT
jgi:hypothetical protein